MLVGWDQCTVFVGRPTLNVILMPPAPVPAGSRRYGSDQDDTQVRTKM